MKKFFLIIGLCFLFGAFAFAQQGQTHLSSLLAKLPGAKEDTNKIMLLNNIVNEYMDHYTDSGFYYSDEAMMLSQKLGWKKGIVQTNTCLGYLYWKKGEF